MKNFVIENGVEVALEGAPLIDLHNDFEFVGMIADVRSDRIELIFRSLDERELDMEVSLIFTKLEHVSVDNGVFVGQSGLVDEIGYKEAEDDDMDWLLPERGYREGAHFVVGFEKEQNLRIASEDMTAEVRPLKPSRLPR